MVRSGLRSLGAAAVLFGAMAAVVPAQLTPPPPPPPGQPAGGGHNPADVKKKISQIIKDGKAAGLTPDQIKANITAYLDSIGLHRPG